MAAIVDDARAAEQAQGDAVPGPDGVRPLLHAWLLGTPRFEIGGKPIVFRSRKAEGLLGYLCLSPDGRLSRELAANLFWGDSSEHHARSSLRQTLLILRRNLEVVGFDALSSDKVCISIDLSRVRIDLDQVLEAGTAIAPRLLSEKRLSERLFEGGEMLADPFTAWLRVRRQQVHDRLRGMLEPMIVVREGNWDQVEDAAVALLNLDPTHEPACRAFITARAARGDYTAALRAYEDLWNVLEEEFDTQPARETQALIVDIKLGRFPSWLRQTPAAEGGAAPAAEPVTSGGGEGAVHPADGPRPVIIVDEILQVDETGADARLARVFRHDLISRLVRFREWSVADGLTEELSASSTPLYRVAISAMRSQHSVSYSVTVKNWRTNAYVWGRNSEVGIGELFTRQSSLVAEIALAMNVNISAERLANLSRMPEATLDHYDRLLMGQRLHFTWKIEESRRAEAMISEIIKENPDFGPAYSSLAQIINSRHIIFPGARQSPETLDHAAALARTALGLDPFDSRAHLCMAWTAALQRRFQQAEAHHRQALELNDNDPWTALSAAHGLAYYGYREEAGRIARQQRQTGLLTSPLHWSYYVGIMFLCGDYQACITAFRYLSGGYLGVEAWYVAALAQIGDVAEAQAQRRELEQHIAERWVRPEKPSREEIARWVGNCFPISDPAVWQSLQDGLSQAGLTLPSDLAPPSEPAPAGS
ncbi:BTAD domain-containing putative transcriptional regulator [Stappia indica]|uniref:BTAD domain-containing putative transcriptional regulator n=1 Tax=Stappia indica TaxID=538381 RepID=UPI001CD36194|nr:BTAD domain-containing putative transcriptional regulator [Stappia indica]MCA1298431.1 hypothetical protein [Stappia indica]